MTLRLREFSYLVVACVVVVLAYVTTFAAQAHAVSAGGLVWGGTFVGLLLAAHVVVRRALPLADPWLLPATALLSGIGITMVWRLAPESASRQTMWLAISLVLLAALVLLLPDEHVLERYRYIIGGLSILALVVTISPLGAEIRGAKLWIQVGPLTIQPGEFAKLGIVVFLASYLREHRELLGMRVSAKDLGPLLLVWGASLLLLVAMNDFGTSLLFYGSFLLLVYVATGRVWFVVAGLAAFVGGAAFVYTAAPHVRQRFDIWLDPWEDPQGAGYQLVQGLFALADGGLFGRGLGRAHLVTGDGSPIIPDAQTDFIFAAIGDELGFVGAVGVLLVFIVVTWRGFAIAAATSDGFSKLLAFGLASMFALQALVIVGGVVRLLPLTGQTLPFISYGGSSLLANFLLVGLLMMISHHERARRLRAAGTVVAPTPAERRAARGSTRRNAEVATA